MGQLGDTLRERRIALGVTLEQAEAATRIRSRLIKALEEGDYARLPNPGYVRGYISSYARFLELDSIALLNLYKSETGAGRFHEISLPAADVAVPHRHQQHAIPMRAALIGVLVLALLSLSVWLVARLWRGPEPELPAPASLTEPTSTVEADEEQDAVQSTESEPAELQPFTVRVSVDDTGASWLRVTVDGKKAYEGTLAGGQSKSFEVAKVARISVGRPSVVQIRRDGRNVKIPAGTGGTASVTLEAEQTE